MRYLPYVAVGGALAVGAFLVLFPEWDRPPLVAENFGPAGQELVALKDPRRVIPYNVIPAALPAAPAGGRWPRTCTGTSRCWGTSPPRSSTG